MTLRRAIVSVGTDRYEYGIDRLVDEVQRFCPDVQFNFWKQMPDGAPPQKEKPYAFKAYALAEAAKVNDLLLWCDASIHILGSLERLWKKIEDEGYWLALNGWTNYEWTADSAYEDLFPGVPIEEARELSKLFPQVVATSFGLNLRHPKGLEFFMQYFWLAKTNAFCGPWANANCDPAKRFVYAPDSRYTTAPCGPPDVLGHRHDQTAASVIAWRLQMKLTECPDILSYPPAKENTLLLVGGA